MDNIRINRLNPDTFEYQTYDITDENLIAQSNLDTAFTASTDYIEYYVYDQSNSLIFPSSTIPLTNYDVRDGDIVLNPPQNLSSSGFDMGTYSIYYSFYRKRLSSNNIEKYFISEISSDRTEIRLDSNEIDNISIISSSNEFIQYREDSEYFVDFYLNFGGNETVIANNIQLETEEGIDPTILVKLYDPLPNEFDLKSTLWVVELLSEPQLYEVTFPFEPIIEDDFTYLKGPNYSLNIVQQTGTPSQEFSYNTLINSDITSSTNQIKSLLNEKDININIDYSNYSNFVKFSSAKTRLENFYYKVGLIESSSAEISASLGQITSQTTSSFAFSSSIATLSNQIDNIIENFDGYEYFLYFNSGSLFSYPKSNSSPPFTLYSTGSTEVLEWIGSADPNNPYYGGQALSASNYDIDNRDYLFYSIPEYLRNDPENQNYELFVDMVGQYYDNTWVYAKDITNKFDADNRLDFGISKDLVADAIKEFAVKLYSNSFNTDDLYLAFLGLTPSGSSFPVVDITGSLPAPTGYEYIDTKVSASNDIVPLNDVNKRLYKRIYHNIPYLLKTKGTIAGIRALITAYGIPDTILRINEFGGKDRNEAHDYDLRQDVFNYAFDTGNSATNFISSSYRPNNTWDGITNGDSPRTIQFRFKSAPIPTASSNVASSDIRYSQSLWSTDDGGNIVLEYTGSGFVSGSYSGSVVSPYDNYGTLKWIPANSDNPNLSASVFLPFFNEDWWSVQVNINTTTGNSTLFTANEIDGKIGFSGSDVVNGSDTSYYVQATKAFLNFTSPITLNSVIYNPFSGSFQELRYWTQQISESKFFDYTVNPYSDEGNALNSTPNELLFRASLGTQLDTGSRTSIHPRITGSAIQITQSWNGDISTFFTSSNTKWVTNVEDIFQDQVVAGMKNRITEKVILKSGSLAEAPYGYRIGVTDVDGDILPEQGRITASALSPMRSLQQFSYTSQSYTPNVNYLEVAFSPSNQINDDINAQLGYFNIGDYIGDPRFISSSDKTYPDLDRLRDAYFEKYYNSYDVRDFIRLIKYFDNSLFKMIKDFTPARTSLASGVVVKQHILERNRQRPAVVTSSFENLSGSVKPFPKDYNTGSSDYPQYSNSGSAIFKFSGGPGGSVNRYNGMNSYPSGSNGSGPNNQYFLTQSYNVIGTAREPNDFSEINATYFNYSSSQFLSASYQGIGVSNVATQHEFYDGEFSGSKVIVTTQSLNPDCAPYLDVVDQGVRFRPHFFNDRVSFISKNSSDPQFSHGTYPNMGTVSSKAFNDPDNEPNPGDAWIFSQVIDDPSIITRLGLPVNGALSQFNYVTSIKLAKLDQDGNDISDFILGSTELQIVLPDASITGDLIVTYRIAGILIERNSIFVRVRVNQNSNKASGTDPSVRDGFLFFPITSSNRGGSEDWTFQRSTTFTSSEAGKNDPDMRQQGVFLNQNTLSQTQIYYSYVTAVLTAGPTRFYTGSSSAIIYKNGLSSSAELSVFDSGTEDLFKQNMFVQGFSDVNDDLTKVKTFRNSFILAERALKDPFNDWTTGTEYYLGANDWGDGTLFDTGAFILKRTPNVPLNFRMEINYSASGFDSGGGSTETFTDGFLLSGSGYNKDASGNWSQLIPFSTGSTGGITLMGYEVFVSTASDSSLSAINDRFVSAELPAADQFKGYVQSGLISTLALSPGTNIFQDRQAQNLFSLPNDKYFAIFTSSAATINALDPAFGKVGLAGYGKTLGTAGNKTNFNTIFNVSNTAVSAIPAGNTSSAENNIKSGLFIPPTLTETVSDAVFDDNTNSLIRGNSGSYVSGDRTVQGNNVGNAGIPRFAVPTTNSISYDFGSIKFAGTFTPGVNAATFQPISSSGLVSNNPDWAASTTSQATTYWDHVASYRTAFDGKSGDGRLSYSGSLSSVRTSWKTLLRSENGGVGSVNDYELVEIRPFLEYNFQAYSPNLVLNATASIEFWNPVSRTWSENSNFRTNFTPLGGLQASVSWGGETYSNYYAHRVDFPQTYIFGAGILPESNWAVRVVIKTDDEIFLIGTEWDVSRTQIVGSFVGPPNFNQFLVTGNRTSGAGTISTTAIGTTIVNIDSEFNNTARQVSSATAAVTGSVIAQAFLKYTGSVYDVSTNDYIVVDTVLTASSAFTASAINGFEIDFDATASNSSGYIFNDASYDASNLATTSSTLALSGGMYYIEYSMSQYEAGTKVIYSNANISADLDFTTPSKVPSIFIGTTGSVGASAQDNPSASITPQIFYGNQEDIMFAGGDNPSLGLLGTAINFDTNFQSDTNADQYLQLPQSQSIVINSASVGTFLVTGSFYNAGAGFNINDTFRFGINVQKSAGNIGVVITSASWGFSPGYSYYTQNFSPYLATQSSAPVPDFFVYQQPTSSEFSIPTFFGNGVRPFAYALDCQPLLGNYNDQRKSTYIMDVDYNNASGPVIPVNQNQILENVAVRAAVPDSNYSSKVWTIPRYTGSRSVCKEINVYTYGDVGTYGQKPNIEVRFAYFAYFGSIVNPYPLYNNVTQLNVTYLIDEQSNALPPSLSGLSYEIMSQLYPPQSTVQIAISSGSNVLEDLNGYKTVYDIGRYFKPITYTQTSSNAYTGTIPLSGSGTISYYDNASNPNARTNFSISVIGQGVSNTDGGDIKTGLNKIGYGTTSDTQFKKLTPGFANTPFEIQSGSNNNASGSGGFAQAPYSASSTDIGFIFTSSVEGGIGSDLKNPQKIYIETSFVTGFIYESGGDEMETEHRLRLIRNGQTSNIPFELEDYTLAIQYLGKKNELGSILGQINQGGGWRQGTMLQFVTGTPTSAYGSGDPNSPSAANFGLTSTNTMRILYENPVYKDLLLNKGIYWKKHGGNANGGPVEYSIWTIKLNTGDFVFKAGDQVYLEFRGRMNTRQQRNVFYPPAYPNDGIVLPINYSVIGANDDADGDNQAAAPYWRFSGSNPDQRILEMQSPNFNEAYGSAWSQGNLPYVPGPSQYFESGQEPVGTKFPNITLPLELKVNDQIRFVNNENYNYNILQVVPPQDNTGSIGKLKIILDKEVPSGSINLDFFLIRRPFDEPGIVYINEVPNQNAGPNANPLTGSVYSSGGVILSSYPSENIQISSSQIVNNLISKGVISP